MKKNVYIVAVDKIEEKFYSYVIKATPNVNLISVLRGYPNIYIANICESKKKAEETSRAWNESYKNNGSNLY